MIPTHEKYTKCEETEYYCLEAIEDNIFIYFLPIFFCSFHSPEHAVQIFIIWLDHLLFCYELVPKSLKYPDKYLLLV